MDTDGIYYWTLNGNWLLDDAGNKIPTTGKDGEDGKDGENGTNGENGLNGQDGTTPKFKIEDEHGYISYDNGVTWEKLGRAVSDELTLFEDVNYENGVLTFTFADGNELSFKVGNPFRIVIGDFDPNWGNKLEIPYTIEGATGDVSIFVITNDIYDDADVLVKEVVEETKYSGIIKVRLAWGEEEYNGKLAIFAVDESGTTVSKILNLDSGVLYSE